MMSDWYRPGVTLDFPKGGSSAMADALVRGLYPLTIRTCNYYLNQLYVYLYVRIYL